MFGLLLVGMLMLTFRSDFDWFVNTIHTKTHTHTCLTEQTKYSQRDSIADTTRKSHSTFPHTYAPKNHFYRFVRLEITERLVQQIKQFFNTTRNFLSVDRLWCLFVCFYGSFGSFGAVWRFCLCFFSSLLLFFCSS